MVGTEAITLHDGDEAFPAMLRAIASAKHSVSFHRKILAVVEGEVLLPHTVVGAMDLSIECEQKPNRQGSLPSGLIGHRQEFAAASDLVAAIDVLHVVMYGVRTKTQCRRDFAFRLTNEEQCKYLL